MFFMFNVTDLQCKIIFLCLSLKSEIVDCSLDHENYTLEYTANIKLESDVLLIVLIRK